MMKRLVVLLLVFAAVTAGRSCTIGGMTVLFAQTVPTTATVSWDPRPASENVVDYQVSLDGGAPVTVLPTSCTATVCSGSVSIASFGAHAWSVFGRNQKISCTNGTCTPPVIQNGAVSTQNFALNQAPGQVGNQAVK